ncbi:hypothetical protein CL2_31470 [Anaerostipes hadrus]|jgi:hypothetical protein|uniref:Uncharacterized protein n=1 Tax=Anaerostipes hadrus TaxID=649756 RepID=D4MWY6_ANAHA|nr:hypothetical protein CL2_31470 [Anaerostipes hadrus]DAJ41212.1 MAG TPA: hypothetical protein [Caudoviricetes sp.]DAW76919.1 MAG TPA: hypothetical protein [Caudoviricetes sp.]DAY62657.1 MAG TPA: hypothetical protein [Caudoviricetes sp.]DAY95519.1 MAG TPA: hypothetical protein [Caudoviricetes sp.]
MLPSKALDLPEGERAFIFAALITAMEGGDA